ncbi:helix-turn-helix transcriptional regulator [Pseudomonas putida]|uniref:Helix-turn-helix transcriptional regulator n=1 Tax=Pseudomonas putida TaxID=303 RepID=A0AAP9N158_PSEPU|nr:AraC family transcriptional regulator [Pseudomonas putida]QJQ11555.1 helix-turn-helix transcriptional regulator [Pseudomonas putida]
MEPRIIIRQGVGIAAGILQNQELEFKRLFVEQPVLIVVERGIKALRWSGGEYLIRAGEAIAIAGGQSVDITNRLAEDGSYCARWLVWDSALVTAYAEAHLQQTVIPNAMPITQGGAEFSTAYQRALQAIEDATIPMDIARHRVSELLLWIGMSGGRFEQPQALTLTVKIRRFLSQDLAGGWSPQRVASAFAMSEATLRRKLADEATTLTEILVDARMSLALKLLQSTALPVSQVAMSVGYQTHSQFSVRFRHRFGFAPTAIRRKCDALTKH